MAPAIPPMEKRAMKTEGQKRVRLTDKHLATVYLGSQWLWDSVVPGLALRVRDTGGPKADIADASDRGSLSAVRTLRT